MILLFSLLGFSLLGQDNPPPSDSMRQIGNLETDIAGSKDIIDSTSKVKVNFDDMEHSPKRAMVYGLIFPGLGQAYNKKYWKIPIVYGALGGVGYWVYYNTQGYREISAVYAANPNDRDTNERYLRWWRRQLELSYIVTVGAYALQVLDAYVDANLFYWDVNPDLSLRMEPTFNPFYSLSGTPVPNYGLKCKLTF